MQEGRTVQQAATGDLLRYSDEKARMTSTNEADSAVFSAIQVVHVNEQGSPDEQQQAQQGQQGQQQQQVQQQLVAAPAASDTAARPKAEPEAGVEAAEQQQWTGAPPHAQSGLGRDSAASGKPHGAVGIGYDAGLSRHQHHEPQHNAQLHVPPMLPPSPRPQQELHDPLPPQPALQSLQLDRKPNKEVPLVDLRVVCTCMCVRHGSEWRSFTQAQTLNPDSSFPCIPASHAPRTPAPTTLPCRPAGHPHGSVGRGRRGAW